MGLKLNLSPTITAPVTFTVIQANGKEQKHVVTFEFLRVLREDMDAVKAPVLAPDLTDVEYLDADVEWLMKFTKDWFEVEMPSGTEFNAVTLRELLSRIPGSAIAISKKFHEVNSGALTKN